MGDQILTPTDTQPIREMDLDDKAVNSANESEKSTVGVRVADVEMIQVSRGHVVSNEGRTFFICPSKDSWGSLVPSVPMDDKQGQFDFLYLFFPLFLLRYLRHIRSRNECNCSSTWT